MGGSASVVGEALVDGRVSLASTFSEQPASSVVATTRPATAQRRSRTAGGYANARRGRPGTVDNGRPVAGSGDQTGSAAMVSGHSARGPEVGHARTLPWSTTT